MRIKRIIYIVLQALIIILDVFRERDLRKRLIQLILANIHCLRKHGLTILDDIAQATIAIS